MDGRQINSKEGRGNDKWQKGHWWSREGRCGAEDEVKRQEGKEGTRDEDRDEITPVNRQKAEAYSICPVLGDSVGLQKKTGK